MASVTWHDTSLKSSSTFSALRLQFRLGHGRFFRRRRTLGDFSSHPRETQSCKSHSSASFSVMQIHMYRSYTSYISHAVPWINYPMNSASQRPTNHHSFTLAFPSNMSQLSTNMPKETIENLSECANCFIFQERSNANSSYVDRSGLQLTIWSLLSCTKSIRWMRRCWWRKMNKMLSRWWRKPYSLIHLCALAGTSIGLIRGDHRWMRWWHFSLIQMMMTRSEFIDPICFRSESLTEQAGWIFFKKIIMMTGTSNCFFLPFHLYRCTYVIRASCKFSASAPPATSSLHVCSAIIGTFAIQKFFLNQSKLLT